LVLDAIKSLGLKVVPADVATAAGLPVLVATQELNKVAAETNAHLLVSDAGTITYSFDPRFEQAYSVSGAKHFFRWIGRIFLNAFLSCARIFFLVSFFLLRMSFGVILVGSVIALAVVAVLAVIAAIAGAADGNGDGGGGIDIQAPDISLDAGMFDMRPWWLYWCFDWTWDWWYYGDYLWGNPYSRPSYNLGNTGISPYSTDVPELKKKSKFLDNCFTLLFGEGDPNAKIDERRWNDIGKVIKLNQGVVASDQIAPYSDVKANTEDWMLPVLVRFNGAPDVTESGNIIYSFPAFQEHVQIADAHSEQSQTNADQLRSLVSGHIQRQNIIKQSETAKTSTEAYLNENLWDFGNLDFSDMLPIFTFAAGGFGLGYALIVASAKIAFLGLLIPLFVGIMIYSSMFVLIPAIRYCINKQLNIPIEERNQVRLEASAKLRHPSAELQAKLDEARAEAIHNLSTRDEHLAYTTEKDDLEQRF
jgi:hypothetical protein